MESSAAVTPDRIVAQARGHGITTCSEATVVAPMAYSVSLSGRYGGIERLAALFTLGLCERGYNVRVVAGRGSKLPVGARLYEAGPCRFDFQEADLGTALASLVDGNKPCTIVDFSHSHPVGRWPSVPSMSIIWHDPFLMQPPLPLNNIVALSRWQAERLWTYQGRQARVLDPHIVDHTVYCPGGIVGDRFICIGKLHLTKGALDAARLCKEAGVGLDIVGPLTPGDPPEYLEAVQAQCDGEQIIYRGEMSEGAKIHLLQQAKALLYPVNYPPGSGEAHSHKVAEAACVGVPCIAYRQGALSEVITDGIMGYLVQSPQEFLDAMKRVDILDRMKVRQAAVTRWSIPVVMGRWLPVMRAVCKGERW